MAEYQQYQDAVMDDEEDEDLFGGGNGISSLEEERSAHMPSTPPTAEKDTTMVAAPLTPGHGEEA